MPVVKGAGLLIALPLHRPTARRDDMDKLQIFVGWDPREDIAWRVCRHSILSRTNPNLVTVQPLVQSELRRSGIYRRPVDRQASTEFSLTRFLTPTLAGTNGFAIFVDCDFLFISDIRDVLSEIDTSKAVSVVQHDYRPKETHKMNGSMQHAYPRKNWSSFIVFNCEHPSVQALTPTIVNTAEPAYLHRFNWLDDHEIGQLDKSWNYLEGWYPAKYERLNAVHYTLGGPWFEHKTECDFADLWLEEEQQLLATNSHILATQKKYLPSSISIAGRITRKPKYPC